LSASQSDPSGFWLTNESERSGIQSGGGRGNAPACASYLWVVKPRRPFDASFSASGFAIQDGI